MPAPCVPGDEVARLILTSCAAQFAANCDDCNKFLKAALGDFLAAGYFDGLNADGIVDKMEGAGQGWTCSRDISTVIAMAKDGKVVVAGMTAAALHDSHGHLAVVVGCDGQPSGETIVPIGYAGSLGNPAAQIAFR